MAEERMRKLIKYLWVNRQGESYQRESYQLQQGEALPVLNDLRQEEMRYSVASSCCETQVLSHVYAVYHADERGPGSSVGIATDYGLDGGDEIFRPSRPALGPTQPPVKWVSGLSRG